MDLSVPEIVLIHVLGRHLPLTYKNCYHLTSSVLLDSILLSMFFHSYLICYCAELLILSVFFLSCVLLFYNYVIQGFQKYNCPLKAVL